MNRINRLGKYLSDHVYDLFVGSIAILNILPVLAPLLAKLGAILPAKAIYTLYSLFCHQLHWRSMHVCDHQYGWCSRCTFMWFNILLSVIAVKFFKVKEIKWYWFIILITPMALDGLVQTVATMMGITTFTEISYMSSNFMRMFTGSMFGIGFGLLIFTNLKDVVLLEKGIKDEGRSLSKIIFFIFSMILSFIVYILMIMLWDATSTEYKPDNILDLSVRTPQIDELMIRGKHAL